MTWHRWPIGARVLLKALERGKPSLRARTAERIGKGRKHQPADLEQTAAWGARTWMTPCGYQVAPKQPPP